MMESSMIDLIIIEEYVQKTAGIIHTIAGMQVLICSAKGTIIGDSKDGITNREKFRELTESSILTECMHSRKMLINEDCKNSYAGCSRCVSKDQCDVNAIIAIPLTEGRQVYGGIGLYAQNPEDIKRLIEQNRDFIEFIHRMGELLIMKLKEESQTQVLREKVKVLQDNSMNMPFDSIIGNSREITEIKEQAEQFARGNSTILIQGESGTGKEIFARAIHTASGQAGGPFVAINCAALPENLIESELFGYEEGAFTGASKGGRMGKFELANKGTLFLDEVGELPIHLQAKLLRTLQERRIQRLGGTKEIQVDVRIIAATNRDLEQSVENGTFREDLYYRLNVIPLTIPPLRQRRSDIGSLAEYFLGVYKKAFHKDLFGFEKETMNLLYEYPWPGNIRELQNAVEYAVNTAAGNYIAPENLPKKVRKLQDEAEGKLVLKPLRYVEDQYIREALRVYGTSLEGKEKAAGVLGISKATLYRRLKELKERKEL